MNKTPTNGRNPLKPLLDQANDALAPQNRFSATPTSRNGNGFHRTDKPTNGDGQWILIPGAKLPPRAFEVHEKERHRFHVMARSIPIDGKEVPEVQRVGGQIFDGTYGAEAVLFEREIDAGRLEAERLSTEKARVQGDSKAATAALEDIPAVVEQAQAEPRFPAWFTAKWWGFLVCLLLLGLSSGAALLQIANLYLPSMQSWLFASIAASPWVLASVAAEIFLLLTLRSESPKVTLALLVAVSVLTLGIILWLSGLFPLAAPLTLADLNARNILLPDRRWAVAGQLLCELAVSFLLLTGMLKLLSYPRLTIPNENRTRISNHISALNREWARVDGDLGAILKELAKPEGNLREWNNSRASFIEEGLSILRLRAADAAYLSELQRQRDTNQRLLDAFNQ
jgi:hypothetical protein